jgi:hypothetical protein
VSAPHGLTFSTGVDVYSSQRSEMELGSLLGWVTEERCAMADRWLVVGGDPLLFWGQAKVKINVSGSGRGGHSTCEEAPHLLALVAGLLAVGRVGR